MERLFRRVKGYRRIGTRYDKLDVLCRGFILFASIFEALRSVNTPFLPRVKGALFRRAPPNRTCGLRRIRLSSVDMGSVGKCKHRAEWRGACMPNNS